MIKNIFKILVLIILTVCLYSITLTHDFVGDDYLIIHYSDLIKSWQNFPQLFTQEYLTPDAHLNLISQQQNIPGSGEASYRPVVTLSYMIDYSVWGLQATGYHITNLLLHLLNVISVFYLANAFTKNSHIAFLSAIFFATHPIAAETLNTISFREDLLANLFSLLTLILFLRANTQQQKKGPWIFLSVTALFLGLFSKETTIVIPGLLLVIDFIFIAENNFLIFAKSFFKRHWPYWAISLFYLWVWVFVFTNKEEMIDTTAQIFDPLLVGSTFWFYIRWFFNPALIHSTYDDTLTDLSRYPYLDLSLALTVLGLIVFTLMRLIKRERALSFCLIFFLVSLLPIINLLPLRNLIGARYMYMPLVAISLLLALVFFKMYDKNKKVAQVLIAGIIVFNIFISTMRNYARENNMTVWQEIANYYPNNYGAQMGLTQAYYHYEQFEKAIIAGKRVLELKPDEPYYYFLIGLSYSQLENHYQAAEYFKKATILNPKYNEANKNLCASYAKLKKFHLVKECLIYGKNNFPADSFYLTGLNKFYSLNLDKK